MEGPDNKNAPIYLCIYDSLPEDPLVHNCGIQSKQDLRTSKHHKKIMSDFCISNKHKCQKYVCTELWMIGVASHNVRSVWKIIKFKRVLFWPDFKMKKEMSYYAYWGTIVATASIKQYKNILWWIARYGLWVYLLIKRGGPLHHCNMCKVAFAKGTSGGFSFHNLKNNTLRQ